jgi:hypothetical protein
MVQSLSLHNKKKPGPVLILIVAQGSGDCCADALLSDPDHFLNPSVLACATGHPHGEVIQALTNYPKTVAGL